MKYVKYIVAALAVLMTLSCQKEEGNPVFGPDEVYVYDGNVAQSYTVVAGSEFTLDMVVSPNDGSVDCTWTLDGHVISTSKNLIYVFDSDYIDDSPHKLIFEATRGEGSVKKFFTVTVTE